MLPLLGTEGRASVSEDAPADVSRPSGGSPVIRSGRWWEQIRRCYQTKVTCEIYRLKNELISQQPDSLKIVWEMSPSDVPRSRQTAAAQFGKIHSKMDAEPQTVKEN